MVFRLCLQTVDRPVTVILPALKFVYQRVELQHSEGQHLADCRTAEEVALALINLESRLQSDCGVLRTVDNFFPICSATSVMIPEAASVLARSSSTSKNVPTSPSGPLYTSLDILLPAYRSTRIPVPVMYVAQRLHPP